MNTANFLYLSTKLSKMKNQFGCFIKHFYMLNKRSPGLIGTLLLSKIIIFYWRKMHWAFNPQQAPV